MSADPYASFSTPVDGAPAPSDVPAPATNQAAAPAVDAPQNEAPKDHIAALLGAGASKHDIERYATGQGIDPSRIKGLDEAVRFRDEHKGAAPSDVRLYSDPVAIAAKPDTLSGLTPDAVEHRFDNLPESMKPGIGDAISHGIFAGLDTEAASLVAGAGTAIAHPIDTYETGGQNVADAYHDQRTTGLARVDYANQHHPILAPAAGFLGAIINPVGAEAEGLLGAAKVGGAYGAVSGFEDNNGSLADRATSAATTGAISALAAPVIGKVVGGIANTANHVSGNRIGAMLENRAANGTNESIFSRSGQAPVPATPAPTEGQNIIDAADRLSRGDVRIQPNAAMVGGTVSRKLAGGSDQTVLGGYQIGRSMNRISTGIEGATDNAAREAGGIANGQTLDQAAAKVADPNLDGSLAHYETRSGAEADRLYEDAYARAGEHIELHTPATIARLDSEIARMQQNPTPPAGMNNLIELRNTLASGTFTPRGLRDMRTAFGDRLDVTDRTTREAARRLWGPLSEDITGGMRAIGKDDAANAFAQADRFYNDRAANLEDVIPHVLGDGLSGEKVADRLVNLSRSDGARLNRALNIMSPSQAGEVRGALITNLGRAKEANSNSTNDAFSASEWATNWNKVSDDAKGIFHGQVRSDLNDLATVIQGVKVSGRSRNNSNTAGALNIMNIIHTVGRLGGGGVIAGVAGGLGGAVGGTVVSAALGRAMSSPGVARAMVGRARGQTPTWFANRLNGIAARSSVEVAKALHAMIGADGAPKQEEPDQSNAADPYAAIASPYTEGATVADTTPDAPDPVEAPEALAPVAPDEETTTPQ